MSSISTIKERLKLIASHYGLSIRAMEERCGLGRGNISNMAQDGNLGSDKLSKIIDSLTQVNPTWLLTGRGDMLQQLQQAQGADGDPSRVSKDFDAGPMDRANTGATRPRIPFAAAAGALSIATNAAGDADCERLPVIATFPAYDFTIKIEGDSMAPDYLSGDELACRFVDDPANIKWGRPHILDTVDGVVLKTLYDGGDNILCKSINKEGPAPYEVSKSDILHVASIVGFTRQLQS